MIKQSPAVLFVEQHPAEAARIVEQFPLQKSAAFFSALSVSTSVTLLKALTPTTAAANLEKLPKEQATTIAQKLPANLLAVFLPHLNTEYQEFLLAALPRSMESGLRAALQYPGNTVGGMMTTEVFSLYENAVVAQAYHHAYRFKDQSPVWIYLIDRDQQFRGAIHVSALLTASRDTLLNTLSKHDAPTLVPSMTMDQVSRHPVWRQYDILPVVSRSGLLLGTLSREVAKRSLISSAPSATHQFFDLLTGGVTAYAEIAMSLMSGTSELLDKRERHGNNT